MLALLAADFFLSTVFQFLGLRAVQKLCLVSSEWRRVTIQLLHSMNALARSPPIELATAVDIDDPHVIQNAISCKISLNENSVLSCLSSSSSDLFFPPKGVVLK